MKRAINRFRLNDHRGDQVGLIETNAEEQIVEPLWKKIYWRPITTEEKIDALCDKIVDEGHDVTVINSAELDPR